MADPVFSEVLFPHLGVHTAAGYGDQPVGTTPVGENVRGFDALARRARGGTRCGLSKYIPTTVNGAHLVQHLNAITDPTPLGLLAADDDGTGGGPLPGTGVGGGRPGRPPEGGIDLGGGLIPDDGTGFGRVPDGDRPTTTDDSTNNNTDGRGPRNPRGRRPPVGGSGSQPNRNFPRPGPIAFVQSVYGPVPGTYVPGFSEFGFAATNARRTITLPGHVVDGNFLVAAVTTATFGASATSIQVRNAALDPYTLAGTAATYFLFGNTFEVSIWFRIAEAGTLEDALHVDPALSCGLSVAVLEFENVLGPTSAALDGFTKNENAVSASSSRTTGAVAVAIGGEVIVGAFSDDANDTQVVTAAGGSTLAVHQHDGTDMPSLFVGYKLGLSAAEALTFSSTRGAGIRYNAAGATFLRK